MKFKYAALTTLTFLVTCLHAQIEDEQVLFTVGESPVYVSEFLRVYNKNLDLVQDESQKDVDEYLKLFTNYKLKIKEARAKGLHEDEDYKRELETYKKQLAKSYMTDNKVSDDLVKEAYEHISYDVNAAHILVRVDQNAAPADTLAAFKKIKALRERAVNEGFELVRNEIHDGQQLFGENLGWFSGFKMVYTFEKEAFNTPVDSISPPFRTRFGYHIVKVLDKRKARGERIVRHIMVVEKQTDTLNTAETRINDIHKKLQQGEDFIALAKEFSDDKNSAPNGGLLNAFSSGQLSVPEFEEAAFELEAKDDISEPVKTNFGWHIIQLVEAKPIEDFEVLKTELEQKVKRDSRSQLIEEALILKLKDKYNISETPNLSYFYGLLNDAFYKRTWSLPEDFKADEKLIAIGTKVLTYKDFGSYLIKYQKQSHTNKAFNAIVNDAYEAFFNENLKQYHEDNLETENEDYAYIVSEYRDGLLLFELMEATIWDAAKNDSIAVEAFYKTNQTNYFWPERAYAHVASSTKKSAIKKVAKLLHKGLDIDEIKALVNTNDAINVIFTSDTMALGHQALPKAFELKTGISEIYKHNNGYIVANVKQVLPKVNKPYNEVKGQVISDYQSHKENLWIEELKKKYPVVINDNALKKVKAQIKR